MSKHQIVVGYDFTATSEVALEQAVSLLKRDPAQILHFVIALNDHQTYQSADGTRDGLVARVQRLFGAHGLDHVDFFVHTRIGRPDVEIVALAEEIGADLVVVGSHSRSGVGRVLLGSVSEAVVRNARCPVLVARAKGYPDVELQTIIEVPHQKQRDRPHRYSYSNAVAQVRTGEWTLG